MDKKLKDESNGGEGIVAIWVNVYLEEENDVIGWYDHDFNDSYTTDINTDVSEIVELMAYGKDLRKKILKSVQMLKIEQIEQIFTLLHHRYDAEPGVLKINDSQLQKMKLNSQKSIPYFLGNFEYEKRNEDYNPY